MRSHCQKELLQSASISTLWLNVSRNTGCLCGGCCYREREHHTPELTRECFPARRSEDGAQRHSVCAHGDPASSSPCNGSSMAKGLVRSPVIAPGATASCVSMASDHLLSSNSASRRCARSALPVTMGDQNASPHPQANFCTNPAYVSSSGSTCSRSREGTVKTTRSTPISW